MKQRQTPGNAKPLHMRVTPQTNIAIRIIFPIVLGFLRFDAYIISNLGRIAKK